MRRFDRWMMCLLGIVLLGVSGCTSNSLDDGNSANVLLEVVTIDDQPVTAAQQEDGVCSGDGATPCSADSDCALPNVGGSCVGASCTLDVQEWSVTLANVPKNELAITSPFNDVVIQNIRATYTWSNGFTTSPANLGGGVVIPANGTADVSFFPLTNEDLGALVSFLALGPNPQAASTAFMTMTFEGMVQDSDPVSVVVPAQLFIEACF